MTPTVRRRSSLRRVATVALLLIFPPGSLVGVTPTRVTGPSAYAADEPNRAADVASLQELIQAAINDTSIPVRVVPIPGGLFSAMLLSADAVRVKPAAAKARAAVAGANLSHLVSVSTPLVPAGDGSLSTGPSEADRIKNLIEIAAEDARVSVRVILLPKNAMSEDRFGAVVSGTLKDGEKDPLKKRVDDMLKKQNLDARVEVAYTIGLPNAPAAQKYTILWPLTFVSNPVTPTNPVEGQAPTASTFLDTLVTTLNALYAPEGETVVRRSGYNLFLSGSGETLHHLKRILTSIDAIWPQVQLDMYAIQISGEQGEVGERARRFSQEVREARGQMVQVQAELLKVIACHRDEYQKDPLFQPNFVKNNEGIEHTLRQIGFEMPAASPLSLTEALALLGLSRQRDKMAAELVCCVRKGLEDRRAALTKAIQDLKKERVPRTGKDLVLLQEQLDRVKRQIAMPILPRLTALCDPGLTASARQGAIRFANAAYPYLYERYKPGDPLDRAGVLQRFQRAAHAVDRMLKEAMDAYSGDIHEMFLDPLLNDVRPAESVPLVVRELYGRPGPEERFSGTSLVGKTRIVVTSNLESRLRPSLESYVETTQPRPFGKDLLDLIFPKLERSATSAASGANGGGGNANGGANTEQASQEGRATPLEALTQLQGLQQLVATMAPEQAALFAALLSADVEPTYAKVAPGIAVNVRPTVLPDASAARLQIDFNFGVESTDLTPDNRTDVWRARPPDTIRSHHARTDAAVGVFDLFDISSFSVVTSHPQPASYVPVLGRLPLIGQAFRFPRGNRVVHHESIVLVNTVILPRAMFLTRFYAGGDSYGEPLPQK